MLVETLVFIGLFVFVLSTMMLIGGGVPFFLAPFASIVLMCGCMYFVLRFKFRLGADWLCSANRHPILFIVALLGAMVLSVG